jgi:serine/threonine-protein kinase
MARLQYGRYETIGLIGSGGMANVYLARARGPAGFERFVAVKVMHEHIARDPEFSAMFLDEARLAAQIRHPNVVPTLDVSEDGHIIVMEYVEGASLNEVLRRERRISKRCLPLPVTMRVILDVLEGLHAAHELRSQDRTPLHLVHRDVSPHNILVGIDGVARITDFGIAFAEARLTSTQKGKLKGKMPYMAPEQLEGAEVDRRIDVYAAGCVLWEMLAGQRLFRADNEAALACRVLAGPEASPRQRNDEVPPSIAGACMRALEERSRRYGTALEFCEALEEAARGAGLEAARPRTVGALARKSTTSLGSFMEAELPAESAAVADVLRDLSVGLATGQPVTMADSPRPNAAPATEDPLTISATAALTRPGGSVGSPLAERPVALSPQGGDGDGDGDGAEHDAAAFELPEPSAASDPPRATLRSEPVEPAADSTGTDASVVSPVSVQAARVGTRWAVVAALLAVMTVLLGWLLLAPEDEPNGEVGAPASAASNPSPSAGLSPNASVDAPAASVATADAPAAGADSAPSPPLVPAGQGTDLPPPPVAGPARPWPRLPAGSATSVATSTSAAGTMPSVGGAPSAAPTSTVFHPPRL